MSYKGTKIDGDLSVGRKLAVGGRSIYQGDGHYKSNLRVDGWLDAKNIKGPCKGLFKDVEKLRNAYPNPRNGWWAIVGNAVPAPIYIAESGQWIASGDTGGNPSINNDIYDTAIDNIQDNIDNIQDNIDKLSDKIDAIKPVVIVDNLTDGGRTSALSAEQGKELQKQVDKLQQSPFITLSDFNAFPLSPSFAEVFVCHGKEASVTITYPDDRGYSKSIGIVSIFTDSREDCITEILETRCKINDSGILTTDYTVGAPKRYYRNYIMRGAENVNDLFKWSKWKKLRDEELTLRFDMLADAVARLSSNILHYPSVVPFDGFVDNVSILDVKSLEDGLSGRDLEGAGFGAASPHSIPIVHDTDEKPVYWDTTHKKFVVPFINNVYVTEWKNKTDYLDLDDTVRKGAVFYHSAERTLYTWNGKDLISLNHSVISITPQDIDEL